LYFKDMENLHLFLLGRNKILTSEEMLLLSQGLTGKNIIIPPLLSGEILKLLDKTTFEDAFSAYGEAYTGEVKKGYNWVLFKDQTTFNHFAVTSPAYSLFNLLLDIAEKDNLEVTNQFVEILKTAAKDNAMQSEELKKYPWLSDIEYSNTKNNNFDADKMTWIFDVLENFSVNLEEKQRILVVGTSSNIKHLELIAKQSPLAQIIGIEWSPQQADKLRNLIKESKELKDKEITIHTQDARNLKGIIEDNSIDVVIYSGVFDLYLESFIGDYQSRSGYQSVKRMLEETRRVLAKGGIVIGDYTKDAKEILSNLNGMEDLRFSSRGFVIFEKKDQAMGTSNDFTKGGIDLNPQMFDLKVKGEGDDFLLPVTSKELKGINIEGFTPVIINITPATNLPMLLGLEGLSAEEPLGKIASTS